MVLHHESAGYISRHPSLQSHLPSSAASRFSDNSFQRISDYSSSPKCYTGQWFPYQSTRSFPSMWSFLSLRGTMWCHEVRFSSSFAGLASPPSQTARTPLDVYGFPLIIFTVLRMNQFMTFRAYHKSFPSPFAHKEYPLRIAL